MAFMETRDNGLVHWFLFGLDTCYRGRTTAENPSHLDCFLPSLDIFDRPHTLLDRPRTLFSCSVLRSHRCRVDAAGRAALLFRRWGGYGITGPSFPSLLHLSSFTRSYSRALRSGEAIIGSWQLRTAKLDVKEGRLPR